MSPKRAHIIAVDRATRSCDKATEMARELIARHALENLGTSDLGVALLRQTLRKPMRDVREVRDPQNIICDPVKNHTLETSCWNTVMTSEQFEKIRQTMPTKRTAADGTGAAY